MAKLTEYVRRGRANQRGTQTRERFFAHLWGFKKLVRTSQNQSQRADRGSTSIQSGRDTRSEK